MEGCMEIFFVFLGVLTGFIILIGLAVFEYSVEKSTTTKELKQCVASREWCEIEQPKLYEIIYQGAE